MDIEYENEEIEETCPWIIRFIFDKELMLDKNIILDDVYLKIMEYDNTKIKFVYSDENANELIGRISIKSNIDGESDVNGLLDQTDVISTFKQIKQSLLESIIIKGIQGVTNIVMTEEQYYMKVDNELEVKKQWVLETDGTNLLELISNEYVNFKKTISNDIIEVYELMGIEAARELLILELLNVFEEYINIRHIELLVDTMTSTGVLISINRQGISRSDIGPLAKCSFEDTTDQLIKAGIFGEIDNLEGVSSNVMMGQKIHAGTNNCEILLDEEKFIELMKDKVYDDSELNKRKEIDELFDEIEEETEHDSDCDDDDFKFSFE